MSFNLFLKSKTIIDSHLSSQDFLTLLLKNRSLSKDELSNFLQPPHPSKLSLTDFGLHQKDLNAAVQRIQQAIKNKENILIYGDYDVDGLTATAILWQTLYFLGAQVTPFVPDRQTDGYGIKAQSVFDFQKQKNLHFSLIITVDNGIVAHQEVKKIIAQKIDIIITDHHLPLENLPSATYILHSTKISGSALSWLVARELNPNADLGMAALGTVADCLPLLGINRSLVYHGLQSLRLHPSPGLKKLINLSGAKQDSLSTYDLGFILGPRLNAVGRLANPTDALRLLCSQNSLQASKFTQSLNNYNHDRQILQQKSLDLAEKQISPTPKNKLIFVADQSFHPGIIGLIAGRLTEKYYLPSIVISQNGNLCKGSCRSIKELNIIDSLRELAHLLVDLGGHSVAAGFSLDVKNIPRFQKAITKIINKKLSDINLQPSLEVEAEMKLPAVNLKNIKLIEKLEPFGLGNPQPLFLFKNLKIISKRLLGTNQDHLKLKLDDPATTKIENLTTDAIAFKKGELDSKFKTGDLINIVAHLDANTWNGTTTPQLIVKEILQK